MNSASRARSFWSSLPLYFSMLEEPSLLADAERVPFIKFKIPALVDVELAVTQGFLNFSHALPIDIVIDRLDNRRAWAMVGEGYADRRIVLVVVDLEIDRGFHGKKELVVRKQQLSMSIARLQPREIRGCRGDTKRDNNAEAAPEDRRRPDAEGEIGMLHVGLKGTMNALFLADLALKTKRGQRGRVDQGRVAGGLAYGYSLVRDLDAKGEPVRGLAAVDPAQAAIIKRIFTEYVAGRSPRAIAAELATLGPHLP
jgi:hypothetical protein